MGPANQTQDWNARRTADVASTKGLQAAGATAPVMRRHHVPARVRQIAVAGVLGALASLWSAPTAHAASLAEAVRTALTTNPALQAQSAEMRAAAYDLVSLERNYLPTVTAFGEAGGEKG